VASHAKPRLRNGRFDSAYCRNCFVAGIDHDAAYNDIERNLARGGWGVPARMGATEEELMTRRWALAAAFFLTAIFGFVVVAYGSSTDMFAWTDGGAGNDTAQPLAPAQSSPAIVTDFVYMDGTAEAQQAPAYSESDERERDHEEREHERDHDDDDDEYDDDGEHDDDD
jgi:hypothetical protein